MENTNQFLQDYKGQEITFTLPSGRVVTLRERDGEVEELLNKEFVDKTKPDPLSQYLSAIMVSPKLSAEDIMQLPSNDKYYMLLKDRVSSLGNEIEFKYTCQAKGCGSTNPYTEDLNSYDQDLKLPVEELDLNDPLKVKPYPVNKGGLVEHTLKSGRIIKFNCLTGDGERRALLMKDKEVGSNTEYIIRNLQLKTPTGEFQTITNFRVFSAREMAELRGLVEKVDPSFTMPSRITCPDCGNTVEVPLILHKSFFFPAQI